MQSPLQSALDAVEFNLKELSSTEAVLDSTVYEGFMAIERTELLKIAEADRNAVLAAIKQWKGDSIISEDRALADYMELSLQLQFNERSRKAER